MQTLAITYWDGIISPLFDAAERLLIIAESEENRFVSVKHLSAYHKAQLLRRFDIQVLMCGAISHIAQQVVEQNGIRVIPWLCGSVDGAVEAFLSGEESLQAFFMPGYGCRRKSGGSQCRRSRRKRSQ
ncbi:MAG: NifB/NifX family molybdenum-iron cluster-binding protein [Chitinivibrionales bacterium]